SEAPRARRRRWRHLEGFLSGLSARPERRRRNGVARGEPAMTAAWPWPAPEDDGGADHLMPGLALPDITLAVIDGMSISPAALDGAWIVFFYPWTGSPGRPNPPNWDDIPGAHGSTPEIEGFRDAYVSYRAL